MLGGLQGGQTCHPPHSPPPAQGSEACAAHILLFTEMFVADLYDPTVLEGRLPSAVDSTELSCDEVTWNTKQNNVILNKLGFAM